MEAETEMKVVQVDLKCNDCEIVMRKICEVYGGDGKLELRGYEYECPRCKTTNVSNISYPYNKYIKK